MGREHTVREHESLEACATLSAGDVDELGVFARNVLKRRDGDLAASNYVGIVTTSGGTVVEILPKIDLDDPDSAIYFGRTRRHTDENESDMQTFAIRSTDRGRTWEGTRPL